MVFNCPCPEFPGSGGTPTFGLDKVSNAFLKDVQSKEDSGLALVDVSDGADSLVDKYS
jgi:hypothetical protein